MVYNRTLTVYTQSVSIICYIKPQSDDMEKYDLDDNLLIMSPKTCLFDKSRYCNIVEHTK
jgi:hypothetical protein